MKIFIKNTAMVVGLLLCLVSASMPTISSWLGLLALGIAVLAIASSF